MINVTTVTEIPKHGAGDGDQGRTLFIANHGTKERAEIWHDSFSEHHLPKGWEFVDGFRMAVGNDNTQHPNQEYAEVEVNQTFTNGATK